MQRQKTRDTSPEVELRRALFAEGFRFRIHYPVPGAPRRSIDIAFPKRKLAVFVDGCFWHGCPQHGVMPKNNAEWWQAKLSGNMERDTATTEELRRQGWFVIRLWEHVDPHEAAASVRAAWEAQLGPQTSVRLDE